MTVRLRLVPLLAGLALLAAGPQVAGLPLPGFLKKGAAQKAERPSPPPKAPAAPKPNDRRWAQESSDLAPDPAVRFGYLPNGMRYAIVKNATPKGQAALRLRFDAGSLHESDAERGLAHYLEHMAFNGSRAVPEGEMIKILQRHGLAFGADTNASTSWPETVYQLDLPTTDPGTVDTGLMLMRETAGELLLDPGAVNRERGVVLSEERARDTPGLRVYKAGLDVFLKGQLAARRLPIGEVAVLQAASAEQLRAYYTRYYRPERAVLVAVGDFDPDAMEAKIKSRFSDWKAAGAAGAEPELGTPGKRALEARVLVEPGAPLAIQAGWVRPPELRPDTSAERRRDVVERLGLAVLNRRFERMSRSASPPFIGAFAYEDERFRSAEITTVSVSAEPGQWRPALKAAMREGRRLVQFGVAQAELDREITEYLTSLQAEAAAMQTRRTPQLADAIVDTVYEREVFTSPAEDLRLFKAFTGGLQAEEVNAALKRLFTGSGPLVFVSTPAPIEGGEAMVVQAVQEAQGEAVEALESASAKDWPYASFGTPGQVAERREIADLDATQVRFANGVRLTVKPTRFRDDQVLVRVRIGNGLLDLPGDRSSPLWAAQGAFTEGGLKRLSAEEIEQVLASKVYAAQFGASDDAFVIAGRTRPEDLTVQMQLLAAYAAEPAFRPEAFARMKAYASTLHDQLEATPQGGITRDLNLLIHNGDRRWAFPTREEIAAADPAAFEGFLAPKVAEGPVEVTIVGDITAEAATAAVASSFGALPPRTAAPASAQARQVALPSPASEPVRLTHKGRKDQAMGYILWPAKGFFDDPQLARTLRVLGQVIETRLMEDLREGQGETYSPQASANTSLVFPGYGYLAAGVEIPPDKLDDFFRSARRIAGELRDAPVSADELDRAKKPLIEGLLRVRQTNEYWLEQLSGAWAEPRRLDAIRSVEASLRRVAPADLHAAAQAYLRDERAWKLAVTPG
ncbi:MAG TPA: insulinase family protein [Caulobacteraceae bacterium]|jgi:zinc protease